MAALDSLTELNNILEEWGSQSASADHISKIKRISELVEHETEAYYKMDPDPFDNRHPGRSNPTCTLGHLFKAIFKNETFMDTLVSRYVMSSRDQIQLQTVACRLLLDVLPGLETSVVFQETEGLVERLLMWAETAEEPLCSYAVGLLSGAMELQDVASTFKDKNGALVPKLLQRLHQYQRQMEQERLEQESTAKEDSKRHFGMFAKISDSVFTSPSKKERPPGLETLGRQVPCQSPIKTDKPDTGSVLENGEHEKDEQTTGNEVSERLTTNDVVSNTQEEVPSTSKCERRSKTDAPTGTKQQTEAAHSSVEEEEKKKTDRTLSGDKEAVSEKELRENTLSERRNRMKRTLSPSFYSEDLFRLKKPKKVDLNDSFLSSDYSNSSWAELEPYMIGSYSLEPLTLGMKQRLLIQYLTPMGEYQELIGTAFEHRAMDLLFYYINLKHNKDVRLAFEALKYLAVLLCHKKFAIEFLQRGGVQKLLDVYRPSIAATGVSICLYYLSYFEDAMERVCLLPDHILTVLVNYVLWLLECSHDSSRCHAAMFFGQAFSFQVILEKFDNQDGLRRLFNVISTLEILNVESNSQSLNEDQVFTMRQSARHVCVALKKYFEVHLVHKVNQLKRAHTRNEGGSPLHETPAYKAIKLSSEVVQENIELLMELMPVRLHWGPESTFHKLGGIQLLAQLIAMSPEWNNYPGKPETIRCALDVIAVCCVTAKSQLALLESIPLQDNVTTPAISVPIGLSEGDILADADVQKSALNVIVNCVCGPLERLGAGVGRYMGTGSKKKINWKIGEDVLSKMWNGVRLNNGIMVLLKLLSVKTPITDADAIRALACKALAGLARSETVRQIISKLPLFTNGQLQLLMKEPVLQDKRQEHVKFCKFASQLIKKVSGQETNRYSEASLDDIRKADIVAQSKIIFQEKELLQLIHNHLLSKGYSEAAGVLQKEADLPCSSVASLIHPASPNLYTPHSVSTPKLSRQQSLPPTASNSSASVASNGPASQSCTVLSPGTPGPIRFTINRTPVVNSPSTSTSQGRSSGVHSKYGKDRDATLMSPALRKGFIQRPQQTEYEMTLDKIVTEYLRKQHGLCRNPVVTCPPMSLFTPHRCPEPRGTTFAPINLTARLHNKMLKPRFGGLDGAQLDRKYIFSRFKPVRTYRENDEDGFSCCTFTACQQYLMLGTNAGDLKLLNMFSGEEIASTSCHSSPVTHCEHSRDGTLVLTASAYMSMYNSALWSWEQNLVKKYNFEDQHLEFSKHVQDRIIGTKEEVAHIYDISTGQQILKLYDADKANNYRENRANFNPTDELVLNDGILWDVRSGKSIHKFDKFNQYVSGVFHPMGLEIIINSEVWDVRTFRLLHTVPALDQCQIRFSHMGDVIYAIHIDEDLESQEERFRNPYGSTFRTFDATNYTSIATTDVKSRSISDLCTDRADCYLAVVEYQQYADAGGEENVCKLYEIGKLKDDDDQAEEEEEGVADEDDDDDDDDDDLLQIDEDDLSLSVSSADVDGDDIDDEDDPDVDIDNDTDYTDENSDNNSDDDDDDDDDVEFELDDDDDLLFELS